MVRFTQIDSLTWWNREAYPHLSVIEADERKRIEERLEVYWKWLNPFSWMALYLRFGMPEWNGWTGSTFKSNGANEIEIVVSIGDEWSELREIWMIQHGKWMITLHWQGVLEVVGLFLDWCSFRSRITAESTILELDGVQMWQIWMKNEESIHTLKPNRMASVEHIGTKGNGL